jgi:hypothetical protein
MTKADVFDLTLTSDDEADTAGAAAAPAAVPAAAPAAVQPIGPEPVLPWPKGLHLPAGNGHAAAAHAQHNAPQGPAAEAGAGTAALPAGPGLLAAQGLAAATTAAASGAAVAAAAPPGVFVAVRANGAAPAAPAARAAAVRPGPAAAAHEALRRAGAGYRGDPGVATGPQNSKDPDLGRGVSPGGAAAAASARVGGPAPAAMAAACEAARAVLATQQDRPHLVGLAVEGGAAAVPAGPVAHAEPDVGVAPHAAPAASGAAALAGPDAAEGGRAVPAKPRLGPPGSAARAALLRGASGSGGSPRVGAARSRAQGPNMLYCPHACVCRMARGPFVAAKAHCAVRGARRVVAAWGCGAKAGAPRRCFRAGRPRQRGAALRAHCSGRGRPFWP